MIATPDRRTLRAEWIILICICAVTALLGRFVYLLRPFDCDGAIFIYMGKMVAEGGRLGHELIDNKFPTVGLMTSAAWRLCGVHWWPYIMIDTAMSLTAAYVLYLTATKHIGIHAGRATGLFALVFMNFTPAVFGGFQLETPQSFFECLTVAFALNALAENTLTDAAAAGLCAGCAAMFKPTGLAPLLAMALAALLRRPLAIGSTVRLGCGVAAGLVIPATVSLIYLTQTNLLREMPALYRQITIYARESVWAPQDWGKVVLAAAFLGFPLLCRGYIHRRQREPGMPSPTLPITAFALTWLLLEILGTIAQRRMYSYHFMPIMAPTALVFGLMPRVANPRALAAAMLPTMCFSLGAVGQVIENYAPGDPRMPESVWLIDHAKPNDTVWLDAWPRVVLESGLHPGARVPFAFLFANYDTAALDYSSIILHDFDRIHPTYIVLPCRFDAYVSFQTRAIAELARRPIRAKSHIEGWQRIHQYVLAHYEPVGVAGVATIWHRRPDATPPIYADAG